MNDKEQMQNHKYDFHISYENMEFREWIQTATEGMGCWWPGWNGLQKAMEGAYVLALLRAATFAQTQTLGLFLSFLRCSKAHSAVWWLNQFFLVGWANKGMISSFLLVQLSCYLKMLLALRIKQYVQETSGNLGEGEAGIHRANLFQITPRKSSLSKQILGQELRQRERNPEQPQNSKHCRAG